MIREGVSFFQTSVTPARGAYADKQQYAYRVRMRARPYVCGQLRFVVFVCFVLACPRDYTRVFNEIQAGSHKVRHCKRLRIPETLLELLVESVSSPVQFKWDPIENLKNPARSVPDASWIGEEIGRSLHEPQRRQPNNTHKQSTSEMGH